MIRTLNTPEAHVKNRYSEFIHSQNLDSLRLLHNGSHLVTTPLLRGTRTGHAQNSNTTLKSLPLGWRMRVRYLPASLGWGAANFVYDVLVWYGDNYGVDYRKVFVVEVTYGLGDDSKIPKPKQWPWFGKMSVFVEALPRSALVFACPQEARHGTIADLGWGGYRVGSVSWHYSKLFR